MTGVGGESGDGGFSAWAGPEAGAGAQLVPAAPPARPEIGGAPVSDLSHEHVIRKKPFANAQD